MVSADAFPEKMSWSTSGDRKLVPPLWQSAFSRLRPRQCIFETSLFFNGKFQLWALLIRRSRCSVASCMGCAATQMQILSVPSTSHMSLSAQGVRVSLLQGLTTQTLHSHSSINVSQSILLLSVFCQSLERWVSGDLQGLPQRCFLPPQFRLAILLVLTSGSYLGKTCLIC